MARLGLVPTVSRSEVDCANHYSIGLDEKLANLFMQCNIHYDETKSKSWPVQIFLSILPE